MIPVDGDDGFAELRALWSWPWLDDDAADQCAFESACRRTDAGAILDAARAWVETVDAPRYLPPLAKWLDGDGWLKPPPKKRGRSRDVAITASPRFGRKVNMANFAHAYGEPDGPRITSPMWGGVQ